MNKKLQAIVPCFLDPLLCQLFFRNYAKYKHKYVDRLIILASKHTSTFILGDGVTNYFTNDLYEKQIFDLKELLCELNIHNYILISDIPPNVEHGRTFSYALKYIKDPDYHTFFDEQDAYWLNNNFGNVVEQLNEYDLVGSPKGHFPYLFTPAEIDKFNNRYGRNHRNVLVVHLPQFLSNRVIQQLDEFDGSSTHCYDFGAHVEIPDDKNRDFCLDTFQLLNLEVYKKTNEVKLYTPYPNDGGPGSSNYGLKNSECAWDISLGIMHIGDNNIDYNDYLLYHAIGCRLTAVSGLWTPRVNHNEFKQWNFLESFHGSGFAWDLRNCFHYQSISRLPNFKYKNNHFNNFELLRKAYREHFGYEMMPCDNGHYFSNRDCTKLLDCIL